MQIVVYTDLVWSAPFHPFDGAMYGQQFKNCLEQFHNFGIILSVAYNFRDEIVNFLIFSILKLYILIYRYTYIK